MSIKKSLLKEIVKECLLEILIEPAFINEMKRTLSREVTRSSNNNTILKNNPVQKNKLNKIYHNLNEQKRFNNVTAKKKKFTGNPLLDEIISTAGPITDNPEAENILDGMFNTSNSNPIKVEVAENMDYSNFLSGVADDTKDPVSKIKKAPPISTVPGADRIKV